MDRVWEERSTSLSLEKAREFIKVEKEYFPNSVCHIFFKVE